MAHTTGREQVQDDRRTRARTDERRSASGHRVPRSTRRRTQIEMRRSQAITRSVRTGRTARRADAGRIFGRRPRRRRGRRCIRIIALASVALVFLRFLYPSFALGDVTDLLGITRTGSVRVEPMSQLPELPNGCEITSLAICLRDRGLKADKCALSDRYLRKEPIAERGGMRRGPDPNDAFVGDPRKQSAAYYCFTKPIVQAANAYLSDQGSKFRAHDLSGCDIAQIERKIDEGTPVMVWTTLDARTMPKRTERSWIIKTSGRVYFPYVNLHCMVLSGYDQGRGTVTMCDPMTQDGPSSFDRARFLKTFEALGSRAVAIW